jgi:hypothetical protein
MAAEVIPVCALAIAAPHVVFDQGEIVAICTTSVHAHRIAELVDRYGLADIPADLSGLDT